MTVGYLPSDIPAEQCWQQVASGWAPLECHAWECSCALVLHKLVETVDCPVMWQGSSWLIR